ncbi:MULTISPECIES: hypothetical protein [unclassified Haloferax]|uniref:hypothetical protein n=1 Tax=unclassified Haloferax TaxID=2625095 RepID=UPI000FE13FDA|nr:MULTISPECIES: hypothetical protein [unclassified Haloferax]
MTDYVCEKCRSEISAEATVCPNCGYNPGKSESRTGSAMIILGSMCIFSVLLSPVGLILVYFGNKKRNRAKEIVPATEQVKSE